MSVKQQLFIPTKIKVGYNNREDTYTKKLAYVIYFDTKGVLRKETSWESWRNKTIEPNEFNNVPTEGFVLNKGVGGQRQSYGWNARNEYIRVYDPRGFEFEISVANLLYILQETTSTKGKGLEGEFVYSWDGKELVLLPVDSSAYKNSIEFTDLQSNKVSAKSLILGGTYRSKKQEDYVYLGKFPYYSLQYHATSYFVVNSDDMYIFMSVNDNKYLPFKNVLHLSKCIDETETSNYAELIDGYNKTVINSNKPIGVIGKPKKFQLREKITYQWDVIDDKTGYVKVSDTEFYKINICAQFNYSLNYELRGFTIWDTKIGIFFNNGQVKGKSANNVQYITTQREQIYSIDEINQMGFMDVFVLFENGSEINFNNYSINF